MLPLEAALHDENALVCTKIYMFQTNKGAFNAKLIHKASMESCEDRFAIDLQTKQRFYHLIII